MLYFAFKEEFALENPCVDVDFGGRTDLSIVKELFGLNNVELNLENTKNLYKAYLSRLSQH